MLGSPIGSITRSHCHAAQFLFEGAKLRTANHVYNPSLPAEHGVCNQALDAVMHQATFPATKKLELTGSETFDVLKNHATYYIKFSLPVSHQTLEIGINHHLVVNATQWK
jgi:hypothetical protein